MKKIGITTTVPVEILFAAGYTPIDLNNIFVADKNQEQLIDYAHSKGLPRNCCNWIKGLYSIAMRDKAVDEILAITTGDCSNTHALTELYSDSGIKVHTFAYYGDYDRLKLEMTNLASSLGTTLDEAVKWQKKLEGVRKKLKIIDDMTVDGLISGFENHLWLVSASDFNSDLIKFENDLDNLISTAKSRKKVNAGIRIGYIGVPPIFPQIYDFIESRNAKVVFNEVQRQFTIPYTDDDIVKRYLSYTYPNSVFGRINDIKNEIEKRNIDGVIHYVQSFCYRQIQDILIRKNLDVPILTIEGDTNTIDGRTKIRLESFIEMLESKKKR